MTQIGFFSFGELNFEVYEGKGGHLPGEIVLIDYANHIAFTGDVYINTHGLTPEQAKFLMKKHEQYPEFIESIINEKYNSNCYKYTTEEIIKCASLINDKNIEAAKILFNTKVIHSYRHYSNNKTVTEEGHRYELYEINSLLKAHSKSLYDFCHYVMKTKRYCPENVKELLDLFDVKSIPQDFITRIKNDIEENWDYRWFRESLSMLESRAQ